MIPLLLLAACSTPSPAPSAAPATTPLDADLATPAAARDPAYKPPVLEGPNRPPKIRTIQLGPASPTAETTLVADVDVVDPDGTTVDLDFVWFVDGAEVMGFTQGELPPGHFGPGAKVRVHVVADDGEAKDERDSAEIGIQNLAPRMVTEPRHLTRLDGFKMSAEDPEGEPLTWSVSGGPEGLSVSDGGVLSYQGSKTEPGGTYTVTIRCDDPHGGWARIDVPITLSPGSDAPKPAPP